MLLRLSLYRALQSLRLRTMMAANVEHTNEKVGVFQSSVGHLGGAAHELDAHRRAALAQADNAKFSSVFNHLLVFSPSLTSTSFPLTPPGGSTSRFAASLAWASSPIRKCDSQFSPSYRPLTRIDTISSPSISPLRCWALFMAKAIP